MLQRGDEQTLEERISAMQARNQRRGAVVLGIVVAACVWLFSVPPDIRRSSICGLDESTGCTPLPALARRIASHYSSCDIAGREPGVPACVAFDFSIDPRSRASFDRTLESLFEACTGMEGWLRLSPRTQRGSKLKTSPLA